MTDGPDIMEIRSIHVRPLGKNEPYGSKEPNIKIPFSDSKKQSIVVAKPRVEIVVKPYKLPLIGTQKNVLCFIVRFKQKEKEALHILMCERHKNNITIWFEFFPPHKSHQ